MAAAARKHPKWISDADADCCMLECGSGVFGMMWRRHHCRYCGWVICSNCFPASQIIAVDRWISSTEGHPVKHLEVGLCPKRVCRSCVEYAPAEIRARRPVG